MDPGLSVGDLCVVIVVDEHVDELLEVLKLVIRARDLVKARRVEVEDALLHEAEGDALAVVVKDRDPAAVLLLPRHRPGLLVRHRVRVLVDEVLPPRDAGRVDRVGHRVAPVLVVERVVVDLPRLLDVGDVGVVNRAEDLGLDEGSEHIDRDTHEDVELELAGLDLGDRLGHVVERRDLVVAVVLLAEALAHGDVEVGNPVVDLQGRLAGLGRQARFDRLIAVEDRPGDRVVLPGEREVKTRVARFLAAG